MPEIFRSIPRTDQQRDRLFLDNFLDALSMVKDILVQEQTDEAVFKPLLPIIKKAFQDERAFELVYGPEKAEPDHLEILAVDPPLDQPGKQIPLTPLFKKLLKRDDARAIQFTPELIAGLEPLQAKKALLIHVKVEGKDHVVGVCSSKEREEALYLGYEARELKVIVELMIFGLRYGAHRKKMLESVQDTAIHLRGDLQPENLLQKLIENAVTLTQTDAGAIMLEEREDGPLVVQNSTRLSEHYCQQQRVERAVYEQALASHEPDRPIIFRDFQRDGLGDLGLIYEEQLQGVLSISMQWGDNHLGAFNLYSKTKDYSFTEEQILIAKTMAEQAGLTLEWEHARQREIQGLRMGSNALGAIRASAEFSQQIFLEQARELLGADGSAVYLADPKSDKWFIHLPESLEIPEDLFMAGVGLLNENRRILEKNESVFVPDLRRFHKLYRHLSERINFVNSLLITPLHNGRRLTGALMLFYAEENHKLSAHQYEIAHIICEQAAAALEIMNLRQKEQQRNKQLEILDRLTLKVAQIPDPKELLDEIISGAMDLVNGQGGVIYRWIEPENEFEIAAIVGTRSQSHFVKKRIPSERGIIQKVHADLKPCAINNYNLWEHRQPELEELNLSAVIGAPLIAGSDFYGVLAIHSSTPGFTFNDEDTRILQRFVNHAVTTLVNREIAELNKQARTFLENALEINKKISQAATLQQGLEFLGQGMLQQAQVSFCLLAISTPPPQGPTILGPYYTPRQGESFAFNPRNLQNFSNEKHCLMPTLLDLKEAALYTNEGDSSSADILVQMQHCLGMPTPPQSLFAIPLRTAQESLGVCILAEMSAPKRTPIDETKRKRAILLAEQAIVPIIRNRSEAEMRRRLDIMEGLNQISLEITAIKPEGRQDALNEIVRRMCQTLSFDSCVIYAVLPDTTESTPQPGGSRYAFDQRPLAHYKDEKTRYHHRIVPIKNERSLIFQTIYSDAPILADDLSLGTDRQGKVNFQKAHRGYIDRHHIHALMSVCIRHGGQPIAVMYANHKTAHYYTSEEVKFVSLFAAQAAQVIRQSQMGARLEQDQQIITKIRHITEQIGAGEGGGISARDEIIQAILQAAADITQAERSRLVMRNAQSKAWRTVNAAGTDQEWVDQQDALPEFQRFLNNFRASEVASQVYNLTPHTLDQLNLSSQIFSGRRCILAASFTVASEPVQHGIFILEKERLRGFDEIDAQILEHLSQYASIASSVAERYQAFQQKSKHLEGVHKAAKIVTAGIGADPELALKKLLEEAVVSIPKISGKAAVRGVAQIWEADTKRLRAVATHPPEDFAELLEKVGKYVKTEELARTHQPIGITGQAALTGKSVLVNDINDPKQNQHYIAYKADTRSNLAVPIKDGDTVYAVVSIESVHVNGFDKNDIFALEALCELAMAAISNARGIAQKIDRSRAVAIMGAWGAEIGHDVNREVGHIRLVLENIRSQEGLLEETVTYLDEIEDFLEDLRLPSLPPAPVPAGEHFDVLSPPTVIEVMHSLQRYTTEGNWPNPLVLDVTEPDLRLAIHKGWLFRILRHIMRNARDAYQKQHRQGEIYIRCYQETTSNNNLASAHPMAIIEVADQAGGIPTVTEKKLFKSRLPREEGKSGQGLLLAQFIMEQHGGSLILSKNNPGEGAVFRLTIPILPAALKGD